MSKLLVFSVQDPKDIVNRFSVPIQPKKSRLPESPSSKLAYSPKQRKAKVFHLPPTSINDFSSQIMIQQSEDVQLPGISSHKSNFAQRQLEEVSFSK